jgi:predicted ATPase/DNA-binding winged helix-turn-helix (wHTH) protein
VGRSLIKRPTFGHTFAISSVTVLHPEAATDDADITGHRLRKELALTEAHEVHYGPFRMDLRNERVWHGAEALHLRPKSFAVLRYFVTNPDRLVTKEELLAAVWPETVVQEAALNICISQLRRVLGDDPQAPRFIETVHRRGYRFIAALTMANPPVTEPAATTAPGTHPLTIPPTLLRVPFLVGREHEVQRLHGWLEQARHGVRQVVFVTGESGLGKTTLVDAFVASLTAEANLWVARGQCLDHHGMGEAYLPVLDALGRLCREPDGAHLPELLAHYAPTWLAQMPALHRAEASEELQRRGLSTSRERMLREFAEVIEACTLDRVLVLVLEDLHWSDHATLDLIAWLARRREPARLLLVGTYRPVDVIVREHPLQAVHRDLMLHGQCADLCLEGLAEAAVMAYLVARIPSSTVAITLAPVLYRRTDGHPLFMVQTVESWLQQGLVAQVDGSWVMTAASEAVEAGVAESLRQMIEAQLDGCSPEEQRLLAAASVEGAEFSAAAVAAGIQAGVAEVEERCATLARRGQFVQARGVEEWPDGTVAGRYGFRHALYQQVVYDRLQPGLRFQLHRRLGEREEGAYGVRAAELAAKLAMHFDHGRDYGRSAPYRRQAAENALRRYAYHEALGHLTRGLEVLQTLPATRESVQSALELHTLLGMVLTVTKGFATPEAAHAYARARELCQQVGDTLHLFPALWGLWVYALVRTELHTARELGEELMRLAESAPTPASHLRRAHNVLGITLFWLGELAAARTHFEQSLALDESQPRSALDFFYGQEAGVVSLAYLSCILWFLGSPDQALRQSQEALTTARDLAQPHSLALVLELAVWVHWLRGDAAAMQERVAELVALTNQEGFAYWAAQATLWRGWILTTQGQYAEGIALMRQGLIARHATGASPYQGSHLALLAEAYRNAGQVDEGLRVVDGALASAGTTGGRLYEAELHRLKGELLLQAGVQGLRTGVDQEAEDCFRQSLAVARRQQAKSWELQAAVSLCHLWQRQGKRTEAGQFLAEVYGWFSEGFDTANLQQAKALLDTAS